MAECPIVETPLGKVKGRCCAKAKKSEAKQVYRYAKIPFAKPPVGDLRFAPPQKNGPWEGVLDGTVRGPMPMQPEELGKTLENAMALPNEFGDLKDEYSEDCLYLDVYTSKPGQSTNLPVLVWIYGGGFQIGSSSTYDGSVLAGLHDVVIVIPNYRVSAYGFLSFECEDSPCTGNMGLMDQTMALEWVKDNIKSFGGDPNNVTIFGESAGAISVSLLLKSPLSKPFFHKAISHSGVSNFPMIVGDSNAFSVNKLMKELGLEDKDVKTQFEELKKMPNDKLNKALNKIVKELSFFAVIKKDGKFFPQSPEDAMKSNQFAKVPYIVGVNNTEGCGILAPGRETGFDDGLSEEEAKKILKQLLYEYPPEKIEQIEAAIIEEYSKGLDKNDKHFWSALMGHMSGEKGFLINSIAAVDEYSDKNVPTYLYYMTQDVKYNHETKYNPKGEALMKSHLCECDHGDDINFTFGLPFFNGKFTLDVGFSDEEHFMSAVWMKYLVNFATTGNPNKGPWEVATNWPAYLTKDRKYLEVNSSPKVKSDLQSSRLKFWNNVLPAILKK